MQLFPDFAELREEELLRRARPRNAGLIARGALDEAGLARRRRRQSVRRRFFRAKAYDKAIEAYTLALEEAPGLRGGPEEPRGGAREITRSGLTSRPTRCVSESGRGGRRARLRQGIIARAAALVQLSRCEDAITAYGCFRLKPPNAAAIKKALAALEPPPPPS